MISKITPVFVTLIISIGLGGGARAEELLKKAGVEGSLLGRRTSDTTFVTCGKTVVDLTKLRRYTIEPADTRCKKDTIDSYERAKEKAIYRKMLEKERFNPESRTEKQ